MSHFLHRSRLCPRRPLTVIPSSIWRSSSVARRGSLPRACRETRSHACTGSAAAIPPPCWRLSRRCARSRRGSARRADRRRLLLRGGTDGFWLHRLLTAHGVVSHVLELTSILVVNRRARRAKTDRLDAEGNAARARGLSAG